MTDRIITSHERLIALLDAAWHSSEPPTTMLGQPAWPLRDHVRYGRPCTATTNPYWDILRAMPVSGRDMGPLRNTNNKPYVEFLAGIQPALRGISRDMLVMNYSWAIISPGDLDFLAKHVDGRPVIEVGAGNGYLAWQLSQLGLDVLAYDSAAYGERDQALAVEFHPVGLGGPEKVTEHPNRVLVLSWPPMDSPMAAQCLTNYTGDTLIYLGEGWGGCTAADDFFQALEEGWDYVDSSPEHLTYSGIHCRLEIYRRAKEDTR